MPRIPVAVAVLALTAAAVGWNMARYPAVWKMVQPHEPQTTTTPQSGKLAEDDAELRDGDGQANAAGPLGLAVGPDAQSAAAPAPPGSSADGLESISIIKQAPPDAFGASSGPADTQSADSAAQSVERFFSTGDGTSPAFSAGSGPSAARPAFSPGTSTSVTASAFSTGIGPSAALSAMTDSEPIADSASEQAVLIRAPSARVMDVSAVSVSNGIARADGLPGGSEFGVSSNPRSGLLRLPRVSEEPANLPPLQWNAPGTPIPVYPSTGIE